MAEVQRPSNHDSTEKVMYLRPPQLEADGSITPALVVTESNPEPHLLNVDGTEADITEPLPVVEANFSRPEENIDAILEYLNRIPDHAVTMPVFLLLKDLVFHIGTEPLASQTYEVKILHLLEMLQKRANITVLSEKTNSGVVEYPIADIVQSIKDFQALGRRFLFLDMFLTRQ